jgi:hypothetical protein
VHLVCFHDRGMKTPVGGAVCVGDQCVTDCVPQGVVKCVRSPRDDNRHAVRILEEGNRKEMICAVDKKRQA